MRAILQGGGRLNFHTFAARAMSGSGSGHAPVIVPGLVDVDGERTELHQISSEDCRLQIVLIPGNPGISQVSDPPSSAGAFLFQYCVQFVQNCTQGLLE